MALPYPTKVVLPFDIATAQDMNERHANDVALANGTGLDDGAITSDKLAQSAGEIAGPWQSWSPVYGASGSMTFTSVTTLYAKYRRVGKTIEYNISAEGTTGGAVSNALTFTLPIAAASAETCKGSGTVFRNTGSSEAGFDISGSTTIATIRSYNSSNWTAGNQAQFRISGVYEAA